MPTRACSRERRRNEGLRGGSTSAACVDPGDREVMIPERARRSRPVRAAQAASARAHDWLAMRPHSRAAEGHLRLAALHGIEIVIAARALGHEPDAARRGVGSGDGEPPSRARRTLHRPGAHYYLVLTNPPSAESAVLFGPLRRYLRDSLTIERADFWATTATSSQLRAARRSLLRSRAAPRGRPDNVLFEGGAAR